MGFKGANSASCFMFSVFVHFIFLEINVICFMGSNFCIHQFVLAISLFMTSLSTLFLIVSTDHFMFFLYLWFVFKFGSDLYMGFASHSFYFYYSACIFVHE